MGSSSLNRKGTQFPVLGVQSLSHWTTREVPHISLDKTKEVSRLKSFLANQEGLLSWKLDGLTIVCTYEEGKLVSAVTRGNGQVGEEITNNARTFKNLPLTIDIKELGIKLVLGNLGRKK